QNSLKHKDTFVHRGVTPNQMLSMAAALAAAGLLAFAALSALHVVLGIVAIALGIAYSAQFGDVKGKCIPVVSSLLHVGGTLIAFMLGALTYASADWRSVLIAAYPVLLILAGHLVQEIQDYEEDRLSGCRTNAVQFGRKRVFVLASAIFAVSFVLLYSLAALGLFPPFIRFTPVLYFAYLAIALRAYRLGLTRDAVKSLRDQYRLLFGALVGIILLGSFLGKLLPA
ncbi:MAG TPA: UbiA family prenyltransferase, partial [Anaerolineales bacterium]|nr:UbiA family prenyltransferase [Anaerolineales bacterium]